MTNRVAALPVHLLSLSNAFEGCGISIDGAGRRLGTGRGVAYADLAFAVSREARLVSESVGRVARGLRDADTPDGVALPVPLVLGAAIRRDYPWPNQLSGLSSTPGESINEVLRVAASQIGVREKGTNRTEYGQWWGADGVFWCAEFVSWTFAQAGHTLPINYSAAPGASGFAYCQYGRDEAFQRGELYSRARPGDIFFHFNRGDSGPGHTGIVVDVLPDGRLVTIEGNASTGSGRDGGGVVRQTRSSKYASALTFWRALPAAPDDDREAKDLAPTPSTLRRRMKQTTKS